MGNTKILYATKTLNAAVGCTPVSAGCTNCWARTLHDQRFLAWKRGRWPKAPAQYHKRFCHVQLFPDRLEEPLHWRKPQRVAVCFGSDLFHPDVPDDFIGQVWNVMAKTTQHTYLILTKRPERINAALGPKGCGFYATEGPVPCPQPNVWLGVSVEDQATADERIPLLLKTPAAKRWVSVEPMLRPLDLTAWMPPALDGVSLITGEPVRFRSAIGWLVIGAESGPKHRLMPLEWALSLREQCVAAGIPCYFKQVAATRPGQPSGIPALDTAKAVPDG